MPTDINQVSYIELNKKIQVYRNIMIENITGKIVSRKWENAMTIDKYSWGYRRNARALDVYTIKNLISQLVETVSFGGGYLH